MSFIKNSIFGTFRDPCFRWYTNKENLQKERAKKVVQGQCLVLPFAKNVKRTGHAVRSAIRNKKSKH